jgi:D-beta-D-heptose 7-phosphate kinase/D-beta-D-heptose 1-phosphate adenosyltransferase
VRTTRRPLSSSTDAQAIARSVHATGGLVVFTNGVFDLLHPGHVRYLEEARHLGEALIVGINSDRSVRVNKGPGRPLNPDHERAEVLLSLSCVDAAVLFDEDTPHRLIETIQPDVLVKGSDWAANEIVGRDVVEARGGRVVRVEQAQGDSTSELIRRVQAGR